MMTTAKLILLRLYNVTLGRVEFFSRMLRKLLERVLITDREEKYVASSRFFDMKELQQGAGNPDQQVVTSDSANTR